MVFGGTQTSSWRYRFCNNKPSAKSESKLVHVCLFFSLISLHCMFVNSARPHLDIFFILQILLFYNLFAANICLQNFKFVETSHMFGIYKTCTRRLSLYIQNANNNGIRRGFVNGKKRKSHFRSIGAYL